MYKVLTPLTSALILTIVLIGLLPAPVAVQEAVGDFTQVNAYLDELLATSNVPGMALAIVRDGEIVFEGGYGFADAQGRPLTPKPSHVDRFGGQVLHGAGDHAVGEGGEA